MSISCDCSNDSGESPEFYKESQHTARKTYKCCECGESIEPGQKYHKAVGVWYGDFRTYRTCIPCDNIRERYCPYGFVFGELSEAISNCIGFDYREVPEDDE